MSKVVQQGKKSLKQQQGEEVLTDVGGIAADALYHHGIPCGAETSNDVTFP